MLNKLKDMLKPKVKVLAGDLPQGDYRLYDDRFLKSEGLLVDLMDHKILKLDKHTTESARNWMESLGWGGAVLLLTGPVLGVVTALLIGRKEQVCAGVTLENSVASMVGTSKPECNFLAVMDVKTFNKLQAIKLGQNL